MLRASAVLGAVLAAVCLLPAALGQPISELASVPFPLSSIGGGGAGALITWKGSIYAGGFDASTDIYKWDKNMNLVGTITTSSSSGYEGAEVYKDHGYFVTSNCKVGV